MKRFLTLIFFAAFSTGAFAQTADEVVSKFIEATGGNDKWTTVNTLQFQQVMKFNTPMGDLEIPFKFYKEKNKLFRQDMTMQFGPQSFSSFTLVNDTAGYIMVPANPMSGSEGGLQKMTEKERKPMVSQMEASGFFTSLVNYAAKGNSVELLKDDKVNKEDVFKLKHKLATGEEFTYYFSKATNLVVKVDAKGAAAANMSGLGALAAIMGGGGRADKMEVSTFYADYVDVDGLKFPTRVTIKSGMGDFESAISDIKVNQQINPNLYKAQ